MEKVQTHQEAGELVPLEKLCSREDGGWAIMDGAASDGAELSGLQDCWQKRQEAGYKHLGEKFVVCVEESDWPQLRGHGHPWDLGQQPHHSKAKGRSKEAAV
jgi:hypothetical protein